jgi:alanine racemase
MPVVKSNAYGHDLRIVTEALYRNGCTWFGVNSIDEAFEVRVYAPEARVLVMGYVDPARFEDATAAGVDLTITNVEEFTRLPYGSRVHVKVETGTHRRGVPLDAWSDAAEAARQSQAEIVGISMHFANIEDTLNHEYAQVQLQRFLSAVDVFRSAGLEVPLRHTACSAASLLFPHTHFELARAGIGLYGLWPSRETRLSATSSGDHVPPDLIPALQWKTKLTQVADVPAGESIGYGCTYVTPAPSKIAVLPVGYFEGYDRKLSGLGHVLVKGHRAPIRGRVCMNMCMVDVTHVPDPEVGNEVVLLGKQGGDQITAEDLAGWAGTIHYEIVSRIHPSIPRIPV